MNRLSSSPKLFVLLFALALLVVGCGPKAPAPDASLCAYLPAAQLQTVTGVQFGEPSTASATTGGVDVKASALCTYASTAGPKAVMTIFQDASPEAAKTAFDKFKADFKVSSSDLTGVGDSAYIDQNNYLHLLKGAHRVYLQLEGTGADPVTLAAYASALGQYLSGALP